MSDLREALEALADDLESEASVASYSASEAVMEALLASSARIRTILAAHPEPETVTEWGVVSKWGTRPNLSKEKALLDIARHHGNGETAALMKRAPAVPAGPWERTE